MEPVLSALARLVAETPATAIPAPTRGHAARVVADTVGAILAGSGEPEMVRLHAGPGRVAGPATLLARGFRRVGPWWAIIANGTAGTMLELDEGSRFARGHPGIHVWPATLADAERMGTSGEQVLVAFILGYDVAARLGAAAPVRPAMHMHGIHGAVGAAAAVARLRGLDTRATGEALAVAAGLTLATSWRTALEGATVRNAYAGVAGANGWLAVDLAEAGFTGLPDMLTETFGRISGSGLDLETALEGLGERFEVTRNYFKRYACCRYNHAAIEALEALLAGEALAPEGIEAIRVETYAAAATMADRAPAGSLAAKFSLPYALAVRLVLGECGPAAFREPALFDPRVRALAARVEVREDPALTARVPGARPARVELRLRDGRRLAGQVDTASGDFDRPYPPAALREKFEALTAPILGVRGAEAAWSLCGSVETLEDARELGDRLRALEAAG
jgi:2-methylcitrate dehydratase PrpD